VSWNGDTTHAPSKNAVYDELITIMAGSGTVTSVSSANARATISSPTTTPVITIVSAPIADTVTTNANLTGDVTSVGNATTLSNTAVTP
jgi:hypothetical protein